MPEAQCIKYPVKPGHREKLVNWIAGLEDRSTELLEVLAEGGFVAEAVFLERSDSGDHILVYTSAQDLQAGMEALSNSKQSVVQEFNQLLAESVDIENAVSLELIYHTP
jgi:Family of unknown function (DUF6176)